MGDVSSLIIDSLCNQAGEKDLAVAWLYCDYLAHQEQSATAMLGAILKQFVSIGEMPEDIRQSFRKRFSDRGLRLPDVVGMLKTTIALLPPVYICIDALDESTPENSCLGHCGALFESRHVRGYYLLGDLMFRGKWRNTSLELL